MCIIVQMVPKRTMYLEVFSNWSLGDPQTPHLITVFLGVVGWWKYLDCVRVFENRFENQKWFFAGISPKSLLAQMFSIFSPVFLFW